MKKRPTSTFCPLCHDELLWTGEAECWKCAPAVRMTETTFDRALRWRGRGWTFRAIAKALHQPLAHTEAEFARLRIERVEREAQAERDFKHQQELQRRNELYRTA